MMLNNIVTLDDLRKSKHLDETNTIWFSIMHLDIIEVFNSLKNVSFTDSSKDEFLKELDLRFRKFKFIKDDEFYLKLVECVKFHNGNTICEFVGMTSGINLGLYFQFEDNRLINIEFCDCLGGINDLNSYYDWD